MKKTLHVLIGLIVLGAVGVVVYLQLNPDRSAEELVNVLQRKLAPPEQPAQSTAGRPSTSPGAANVRVQGTDLDRDARRFYEKRGFHLAWIDAQGPRPVAKAMIEALGRAEEEGLKQQDYDIDAIRTSLRSSDGGLLSRGPGAEQLADLDIRMTTSFLRYASDLSRGRETLRTANPDWHLQPSPIDTVALLDEALKSNDIPHFLEQLCPPHADYARLKKALADYRALADAGGWPTVTLNGALKVGGRDPGVVALRRRLSVSGDLAVANGQERGPRVSRLVDPRGAGSEPRVVVAAQGRETSGLARVRLDSQGRVLLSKHGQVVTRRLPERPPRNGGAEDRFDTGLQKAVRLFQRRHGLDETGIVDAATLAQMNVPVEERLRAIRTNMERWRWAPRSFGNSYVVVNVPGFTLNVVDNDRTELAMRIVAGQGFTPTPVFSDRITYLVLNPSWNIPERIAREEIVPELQKDPSYLARKGIHVLDGFGERAREIEPSKIVWSSIGDKLPYAFRQEPGPENPLGRIKFMLPNQFDVYLHDTPAGHLFRKADRALSHGCIRLEKPIELASFLLEGTPWTRESLLEAIQTGETQEIPLPQPFPVHIVYMTVKVDEDGTVQFFDDIYGFDRLGAPV